MMAQAKKRSRAHYIGMGTKSQGTPNVAYPRSAMTQKSGNSKTTGKRKRIAGKRA